MQDKNILIHIDCIFMLLLVNNMISYNIDHIELLHQNLNIVSTAHDSILVNDELVLLNKQNYKDKNNVFNVQSALYKRDKLIELFNKFPNRTYRLIEHGNIQQQFITILNAYVIHAKYPVKTITTYTSKYYVFLPIIHWGKIISTIIDGQTIEPYLLTELNLILNKYFHNTTREYYKNGDNTRLWNETLIKYGLK